MVMRSKTTQHAMDTEDENKMKRKNRKEPLDDTAELEFETGSNSAGGKKGRKMGRYIQEKVDEEVKKSTH